MQRKFFALVLSVLMVLPVIPVAAREDVPIPVTAPGAKGAASASGTDNGTNAIGDREALELFRQQYPAFCSGLELRIQSGADMNQNPVWEIASPPDPTEPNGRVRAVIDTRSGEIVLIDFRPPSVVYKNRSPVLTRAQARQVADNYLQTMTPQRCNQLKSAAPEQSIPVYTGKPFQSRYLFTWKRVAEGVEVDWDQIQVGVDAYTGSVTFYSCTWQDSPLPPVGPILSREEAWQLLGKKAGIHPGYIPCLGTDLNSCGPIVAVYSLNTRASFIDARSGELLDQSGQTIPAAREFLYARGMAPLSPAFATEEAVPTGKISPAQSRQAAIDFLARLGYQGTVEFHGGGSVGGYGFQDEYTSYQLSLPDNQPPQVDINNVTGDLQGFYIRNEMLAASADPLPRAMLLQMAQAAIRMYSPDKSEQVIPAGYELFTDTAQSSVSFFFARVVNGLPLPRDFINVTLDRCSGQVQSYLVSWHPVQCKPVAAYITPEQAWSRFQSSTTLDLTYLRQRGNDFSPSGEARLVYRLPQNYYVDAASGAIVNNAGIPFESAAARENTGSLQNAALSLLQENGLVSCESAISPDLPVTRRQALQALVIASNSRSCLQSPAGDIKVHYSDLEEVSPDLGFVKCAVQRGMVPAQGRLELDRPITRAELAVWAVRLLGYAGVEKMSTNFALPFTDREQLEPGQVNCVAVAYGLGLMTADSPGTFRPREAASQADLALLTCKVAARMGFFDL